MGVVVPLHSEAAWKYRGYKISPTGYGGTVAFQYFHDDFDGPEDRRHGTAATVAEAVEEIDELEDRARSRRVVDPEHEPILQLRDVAAAIAVGLIIFAVALITQAMTAPVPA